MKDKKYQYLLYLISAVIAITLAIQVYWNYKNYQESEQQLRIDLQTALDQSVEDYFTLQARNNRLSFIGESDQVFTIPDILENIDFDVFAGTDSLAIPNIEEFKGVTVLRGDDIDNDTVNEFTVTDKGLLSKKWFKNLSDSINNTFTDTLKTSVRITNLSFTDDQGTTEIKDLTDRIIFSLKTTKVDREAVDNILSEKLEMQNMNLDYNMFYFSYDVSDDQTKVKEELNNFNIKELMSNKENALVAQSELISDNQKLGIEYKSLSGVVLKRNLTGILLSTLLIATVIFCLFYLLAIIKKQKALSIMKNDLISNITHEFKTPIATASAALEGVQSFTASGDQEKTNRYLSMSREQLHKLHGMVEKLLDTATLDSQELVLQKSDIELESLIADSVSKFQEQTSKQINYEVFKDTIIHADVFHLENALSNLIDNAIKYGGNEITINAYTDETNTIITIRDSGTDLKKSQEKLLFDQFYRVPKGNQHDVKGFGIGLYYTKSIIDKHNGSIELITKPSTTFKISIPNE